MNHQQAIENQTAERYLLGELPPAQRDDFEEHFFDCQLCAADVSDGAAVVAGVRLEAGQANPFLRRKGRRNFTPPLAAAASLLVALLAWQHFGVVRPLQRQLDAAHAPRLASVYTLRDVRADRRVTVGDGRVPFTLDFDIPADPPSPRYTCTIVDAAGKARYSVPVSAAQARDTIHLNVDGGTLPAGDYTLHVDGANGAGVVTYELTVR